MLLLGEIVAVDGNACRAEATASPDWPTASDTAVSVMMSVELVAQAVAAVYGWRLQGKDVESIGYILGIKEAAFNSAEIEIGEKLIIIAKHGYGTGGYSVFEGSVSDGHGLIATMIIQTLGPDDTD